MANCRIGGAISGLFSIEAPFASDRFVPFEERTFQPPQASNSKGNVCEDLATSLLSINPQDIEGALKALTLDYDCNAEDVLKKYLKLKFHNLSPADTEKNVRRLSRFIGDVPYKVRNLNECKDNCIIGSAKYSLSPDDAAKPSFYEEATVSEAQFTLPDGKSQEWHQEVRMFYHPATLELAAFSWKLSVSENNIVREYITYNGVKLGMSYKYARMHDGVATAGSIAIEGNAPSLERAIELREAAMQGKTPKPPVTQKSMEIESFGLEIVEQNLEIKRTKDHLNVEVSNDTGVEQVVYDKNGRAILSVSSGIASVTDDYAGPLAAEKSISVVRPASEGITRLSRPETLVHATYQLSGATLPDGLAGRYKVTKNTADSAEVQIALEDAGSFAASTAGTAKVAPPTSYIPYNAPEIITKAGEITRKETTAWRKAVAILDWVDRNVYDGYSLVAHNAFDILKNPSGDCTEHTLLFLGLTRAAGIPSRGVVGLVYIEEMGGFAAHQWAEINIGNTWVAMDPTLGQEMADVTHLPFVYSDRPAVGKMTDILQSIKIKIEDVSKS